jgi:hypothetical protein
VSRPARAYDGHETSTVQSTTRERSRLRKEILEEAVGLPVGVADFH